MIRTLLADASEELAARYNSINGAALTDYVNRHRELFAQLRPEVAGVAARLGVYPPGPDPAPEIVTPQMNLCRLTGVPIPPDWAESGTPWVLVVCSQ